LKVVILIRVILQQKKYWRCGETDHSIKNCKVAWNKAHCTTCNNYGHLAKACKLNISKLLQNNKKSNDVGAVEILEEVIEISKTDYDIKDSGLIILDTGCTKHITNDKSYLKNIREIDYGKIILVGFDGNKSSANLMGDLLNFGEAIHSDLARNTLVPILN
jgi:hypothetical protein